MNERDVEMHEQNDPLEHSAGEVEARMRDDTQDSEVGNPDAPSPTNPEMRRDQEPGAL